MKRHLYNELIEHKTIIDEINKSTGMIVLSNERVIISANKYFTTLVNYEEQDVIGRNFSEIWNSDKTDSKEAANHYKDLINGKNVTGKLCLLKKDLSDLWIHFFGYPIITKGNSVNRILIICHDITEKQNHKNCLALDNNAINQTIIRAEISPTGKIISSNSNFSTLFPEGLTEKGSDIEKYFVRCINSNVNTFEEIWNDVCSGHTFSKRIEWAAADKIAIFMDTVLIPVFSHFGKLVKIILLAINHSLPTDLLFTDETCKVAALSHNGVAVTDRHFQIEYINKSFTSLFGYTQNEIKNQKILSIFGPNQQAMHEKIRKNLLAKKQESIEEITFGKDGKRMWASLRYFEFKQSKDMQPQYVFIIEDITCTKIQEIMLQKTLNSLAQNASLETILRLLCMEVERISPDVLVVISIVDNNKGMCKNVCAPSIDNQWMRYEKLVGNDVLSPSSVAIHTAKSVLELDIQSSEYPQQIKELCAKANKKYVYAFPIKSFSGQVRGAIAFYHQNPPASADVLMQLSSIMAQICSFVFDQEDSKIAMRQLSFYDPVTKLPNQELFLANVENYILLNSGSKEKESSLALLVFDIDRLNQVYSSLGLAAADKILGHVASSIESNNHFNAIMGRINGDKIAMALPGVQMKEALDKVKDIQAIFKAPFVIGDNNIFLSFSIGISFYPNDAPHAEQLLKTALSAVRRARQKGLGCIEFHSESLNIAMQEDMCMESCLREAIKEKKLHLHYQPQVYLDSKEVYGVEALARWEDPKLGCISPTRFVNLAEKCGLIANLTDWVIEEACRQLGEWKKYRVSIPKVSINISSINFHDPSLPEKLQENLNKHGLSPSELILELTESVMLDNSPVAMSTLLKTHEQGFPISLDDFGTGYSSLKYLLQLPISSIKLDQSFVKDIHFSNMNQRLSQAIMHIGNNLNLNVVAEGIETKEQFELLRQLHYHVAQGYYISKPKPAMEIGLWLDEWLREKNNQAEQPETYTYSSMREH